jgi:hypothetical protein
MTLLQDLEQTPTYIPLRQPRPNPSSSTRSSPITQQCLSSPRHGAAMSSIAETQTRREQEISTKHESAQPGNPTDRAFRAAQVLQRTYRGRRERRQLAGLSLDPSTRWTEAIKEAQYRELTRPRPRATNGDMQNDDNKPSGAIQNWRRVSVLAGTRRMMRILPLAMRVRRRSRRKRGSESAHNREAKGHR